MVLHQHVDELLGKVLQDVRVAIGDVRNEIDQVSQRDNTGIRSRRGRRHENFAMRFILVVLSAKIFNVGPAIGNNGQHWPETEEIEQ